MRFHSNHSGRGPGRRFGKGFHGTPGGGFQGSPGGGWSERGSGGLGNFVRDRLQGVRAGAGLYRSRNGMILGVCRGLANYFDLSVRWTRIITFVAFLLTGVWPVLILYVVAALLMKPEPVVAPKTEDEAEFYQSYASSRAMAVGRLKRTYERLEGRLRRLEDVVTSPEFHWEEKAR